MRICLSVLLLICAAGCLAQSSTDAPEVETTTAPPTPPPTTADSPTSSDAPTTTTTKTTTTTSTASPNTTTTSTTTAAPAPKPDDFFRVTEDGVTCVMFSGDIKFNIKYPTTQKTTAEATVRLPKPTNDKESVTAEGSCSDAEQKISVSWGPTNTRSSFTLLFNSTGDKWSLIDTDAILFMDPEVFTNATDADKFIEVTGVYPGLSFVSVDTNASFICHSAIDSKNFTGMVKDSNATYTVTSSALGFKAQAYNSVPNDTNLQNGVRCEADMTSDLVPIAVGCALAGLVVLVLVSYLVGRRRRNAAYQSV